MKPIFWFGIIALIFGAIAGYQLLHFGKLDSSVMAAPPEAHLKLGDLWLDVYVADSATERQRGLGGREYLAQDQGMIFVFSEDGSYTFWMKDMHFPIDILWLASDGRIVTIAPHVAPDTYPEKTFSPTEPARYVLEVNAGFVDARGVEEGDYVHFQ